MCALHSTDRGDYVVRKDQDVDGVYFVLEGQVRRMKLHQGFSNGLFLTTFVFL